MFRAKCLGCTVSGLWVWAYRLEKGSMVHGRVLWEWGFSALRVLGTGNRFSRTGEFSKQGHSWNMDFSYTDTLKP